MLTHNFIMLKLFLILLAITLPVTLKFTVIVTSDDSSVTVTTYGQANINTFPGDPPQQLEGSSGNQD